MNSFYKQQTLYRMPSYLCHWSVQWIDGWMNEISIEMIKKTALEIQWKIIFQMKPNASHTNNAGLFKLFSRIINRSVTSMIVYMTQVSFD